jgi:hypothetical protein
MLRGEDLEVDGEVSTRLAARADRIQRVYSAWNPTLRPRDVRVAPLITAAARSPREVAVFYSRGVDSTYSATVPRAAADRPARLVFVERLDPRLSPDVRREEVERAHAAARLIGLPLTVVETNVRDLSEPLCDWEDLAGAGLAFVALGLSGGIRRMIIPSSDNQAALTPCGTHPLLDPLFSSDDVEVEHDDIDLSRTGKIAHIAAEAPELLPTLKVCFAEDRPDNCGRCGKCVVTMAGLQAAGALAQATEFPDRVDIEPLSIRLPPSAISARYTVADVCGRLPRTGEAGRTRQALLAILADPGPPPGGTPDSPLAETFRTHHAHRLEALRTGRLYEPGAARPEAPSMEPGAVA